jgi:hypothetical protein
MPPNIGDPYYGSQGRDISRPYRASGSRPEVLKNLIKILSNLKKTNLTNEH